MIDDQNPGVSAGEQPEEANIPREPSAPAAEALSEESPSAAAEIPAVSEDRAPEPVPAVSEQAAGRIIEGVKAVSEISEAVSEMPADVPEQAEAPVPSVEEPVYPEQAPAPESGPVSQAPAFSAPCAEPSQGEQAAAPGYAVGQQGVDPQMGAVPPGAPTEQAAPGAVFQGAPAQESWPPQGAPVYQQPYPKAGYAPYQQAPYPFYPQPVPPAQNFYTASQQPVQGQTAAPYQPAGPAAPQQGYYTPPVGWGYPQAAYGYGAVPSAPKKKMSTGLKVFIWIASILAAAAILGFGAYLIYHAASGQSQYPTGDLPYGYHQIPGLPDGDDDDGIPDFDDGVTPPEADEDADKPDVDVTPNNDGITVQEKPAGVELSAQAVYEKVVKSTVTVAVTLKRNGQEQNSTGTGIIATADGYIITNSHVVLNSKSSTVEVTTYDGQQYEAVVVGVDRTTDLAVLKTNDHQFTPAEFGDADQLAIGDSVVAIGNPGGAKFSGSMTGGYVSGLNREVGRYSENGMTYIQTDAAINPGNSGGPLVNMYGQVVGINSSKIITDGYEGMGFAIPVSKAKSVIDVLLSGGYVEGRTRLGITGTEINEMQASIYGMPRGFMISEINEESAFTGTDAQAGDIITAMDGEVVTGLNDISNLLTRYAPGDKVTITLYRQGRGEIEVEATLLEDKGETQE